MFKIFMRSEEFGYEEFRFDTLEQALNEIAKLYEAAVGDGVEREIGIKANSDFEGEPVECRNSRGIKEAGADRDEYFVRSPDPQLKLNEILVRLRRIEDQLVQSNKLQAPSKEFYSVEDFAELVDLAPYTVREHCRLQRLNARKTEFGRGGVHEWRIPHAELVRYRNYGLLPIRKK